MYSLIFSKKSITLDSTSSIHQGVRLAQRGILAKRKGQTTEFCVCNLKYNIQHLINKHRPLKNEWAGGRKSFCVALRGTTRKHNGNIIYLSTMATGSEEDWGGMDGWYKKIQWNIHSVLRRVIACCVGKWYFFPCKKMHAENDTISSEIGFKANYADENVTNPMNSEGPWWNGLKRLSHFGQWWRMM